jgi:hypothetical protein
LEQAFGIKFLEVPYLLKTQNINSLNGWILLVPILDCIFDMIQKQKIKRVKSTTVRASRTPDLIAIAFAGALWLTNAQAADDEWKYSVTPYLWLPSFNANFKYSLPPSTGGSPEVETYYLNKLNAALMLTGDARKGKLSFLSDLIYIDISGSDSHVRSVDFGGTLESSIIDAGTQTSIKGTVWTIGSGYTVVQTPDASLDVIGGLRYLGVDVSTDWHLSATVVGPPPASLTFPLTGTVTERVDLWDAIIGVRGRFDLGDAGKWSVPYYFDVGTGSSTLTWQGMTGLAYTYGWGDVSLSYRHLYYGQKSDQLIQSLALSGPLLGATFRF